PAWSSDFGGRGVPILACFQSRAQLIQRYGGAGAAVLLNNAGSVLLFGGTKDVADLEAWSTLAGPQDEGVKTRDERGKVVSTTTRPVPVLTPAQIAKLPEGQAVVFRRGMSPAVGRVPMAWQRRDVKRAKARAVGWAPAGDTPASSPTSPAGGS